MTDILLKLNEQLVGVFFCIGTSELKLVSFTDRFLKSSVCPSVCKLFTFSSPPKLLAMLLYLLIWRRAPVISILHLCQKNISTTRLNKNLFTLHGLLHTGICIRRYILQNNLSTDKKNRPEMTSHEMLSKVCDALSDPNNVILSIYDIYDWPPRFSRSANTITLYGSGRCILTYNGRLKFVLISFFAIQIDFRQSMTVVAIVSKGTNDALFQEWVKSYQVKYLSGQTWIYVNHGSNNVSRKVLLMSFRHSISYLGTGQV